MGLLSKVYNLVWHGDCDDPDCVSLNLTQWKNEIDFVFQVSDINSGWKHWSSQTDGVELGDFQELICGIPYVIKLKSDDKIEPNTQLEIPNVVVGSFADEESDATPKRITENCVPIADCSFVIDNIRTDRFDLMINMSSLDPAGTNNFIRGVEIVFNTNLELSTDDILPITFDERHVMAKGAGNDEEAELYKELSDRTTSMVTYGKNKTYLNKMGFADLREFSVGISHEDEFSSMYKFRIPYNSVDGEIRVLKANIFDTTIERKKYDYILCDEVAPLPSPTPTPTRTPSPTPSPTPTPTPAERLWVSFTGEGHYSPFYEAKKIETRDIVVPFDNFEIYNNRYESENLKKIEIGDEFNVTNYVSSDFLISPIKQPTLVNLGLNADVSDLNGFVISVDDNGNYQVVVTVGTDYTSFKFADSNFDSELYKWANGQTSHNAKVSNIQGVMITTSEEQPVGSLNEEQKQMSFDSYMLSLKCGNTWNYELSPLMFANLRFDCYDSQRGSFLAKYGHWGSDHGYLADGKPWAGANMVYTAPQPTSIMNDASGENKIGIKEFYFIRGTNESQKINFSQGNPDGSVC